MRYLSQRHVRSIGWDRSGVLGRIDVDGYLHVFGRVGDIDVIDGHMISPTLIENTLYSLPNTRYAAVVVDGEQGHRVAVNHPLARRGDRSSGLSPRGRGRVSASGGDLTAPAAARHHPAHLAGQAQPRGDPCIRAGWIRPKTESVRLGKPIRRNLLIRVSGMMPSSASSLSRDSDLWNQNPSCGAPAAMTTVGGPEGGNRLLMTYLFL
jgi:hypothetical protein